jgi:hypothetical protein
VPNDDPKRAALDRLHDAIEESIETASGADLREDILLEGRDPAAVAAATRAVFARVTKHFQQKRLIDARRAREAALSAYERHKTQLPSAPQARRALLQRVITAQPHLTMQFRDLDHQSDADVESALKQLALLGLLPSEPEK